MEKYYSWCIITSEGRWKMMSRRFIGAVLILLGAIVMAINVLWFQNHELYDTVRIASFVSFIAGFLLIPRYQERKNS